MSAEDEHWTENRCDGCGKRIHPNAGALCVPCALDFHLPDDPFYRSDLGDETTNDVFDAVQVDGVWNRGIKRDGAA